MSAIAMVIAGAMTYILTGLFRKYALTRMLLDVPNERSSHTTPTPRGGGLAIAAIFVIGVIYLRLTGVVTTPLVFALLGGGTTIAIVGIIDDYHNVRVGPRLLIHFAAVVWAICWLGGMNSLNLGGLIVNLGIVGAVLEVCCLVWFVNLYNFMDGTDGLASLEAIFIAGGAALVAFFFRDADAHIASPLLLLIATVTGFLIWNWPPASIFMGDVGSGFLGYTLGVLAAETINKGVLSVWVWLILGGCFFVDATVTLFIRFLHGERVHVAHRSHAYQRLSRYWGNHIGVLLLMLGINVIWLLPLAFLSASWPNGGALLTGIAWLPLIVGALWLGAGTTTELQ